MTNMKGKTAVVTGSTSGIGLAYARAFASAGANVVINGFGAPADIEKERSAIELGRHECQHAQRAARAVDDLQRRCDHDRARGGQLVEVGETRQAEAIRAVHDGVAREHGLEGVRLAGIGTDRLHPDPENVTLLGEERYALRMKARRM